MSTNLITRRRFGFTAAATLAPYAHVRAQPSRYPERPIRLVLPVAAGGGTDVLARGMTDALAARLGQPVIVDNKPGGTGIIGIESVSRSAPDGHVILFMTSAFAILPGLHRKLPYDSLQDFTPVTRLTSVPHLLVTHPSLAARNVQDLIALVRSKPNQLNYGSQSLGSSSHLTGEMFQMATGTKLTHVPYSGAGKAITAVLAGEVPLLFSTPIIAEPHIKSGKLRLLAVTSSERTSMFPEAPTMKESGLSGFESLQWHGIWVPARTPPSIVDRLHSEFSALLLSPEIGTRLRAEGAAPVKSSPKEFAAFVEAEIKKWGELVRGAGIKPEG